MVRRSGNGNAVDHPQHDVWSQRLIFDTQCKSCAYGITPLLQCTCGIGYWCAGDRPDFTSEPQDGEKIPTVRFDVNINHVFAQVVNKRRANRCRRVKDQNPITVVRGVEFLTGAEHPLRGDPHLFRALNASSVGHFGTD